MISSPENKQSWLDKLSNEEKERLYNAIGYDVNKNIDRAPSVSGSVFSRKRKLSQIVTIVKLKLDTQEE